MRSGIFDAFSQADVADEAGLRECLHALPAEGVFGLDTETFWNPSRRATDSAPLRASRAA